MAKDYDGWESMFAEPSGSDGGSLGTIALALAGIGIGGGLLLTFGKDESNKPVYLPPRHFHDAENLPGYDYRAQMMMQEHLSKGHSSLDDKDVRLDEAVFELSQKVKALNAALESSKEMRYAENLAPSSTLATYENLDDLELRLDRSGQSARYELQQRLSANLDSTIALLDKEYWRNAVEEKAAIRDLQMAFLHHLPTTRIEDGASYTAPGSNLFGQTFENGKERKWGDAVAKSGWRNGHEFSNKHGEWKPSWYESSLDPNFEGYENLWYPPWMESWQGHQFERFDHRKMHELNRNHSNIGVGIFRNSLNANQVQPWDWPGGEQRMRNAENEISDLESRYTRNIYGQDGLRQYAMNHENRISNLEDALA